MYKPKVYSEKDLKKIFDFIERYPFAFITCCGLEGMPMATQIPLIFDAEKQKLQGHVMRHTDHHKAFSQNPEVLLVFTGPNAYVSGSWYSKPQVASTWNYISVHVQGRLSFMNDEKFVDFMNRFTLKFEGGDKNSPTYYENIPDEYQRQHMKAITGIEITTDSIEATFKLSQDKDEKSYLTILENLRQNSHTEQSLADEMERYNNY